MDKFRYKVFPKSVIKKARVSKEQLAKWMGLDKITFDYALPQEWLERFVADNALDYSEVLSTTFYAYPPSPLGSGIVSGCKKFDDLLGKCPNWERTECNESPEGKRGPGEWVIQRHHRDFLIHLRTKLFRHDDQGFLPGEARDLANTLDAHIENYEEFDESV